MFVPSPFEIYRRHAQHIPHDRAIGSSRRVFAGQTSRATPTTEISSLPGVDSGELQLTPEGELSLQMGKELVRVI